MKTKAQALQDTSDVLAGVLAIVSDLTPRQAAERAWHPGGLSVDELTEQIRGAGICRADDWKATRSSTST